MKNISNLSSADPRIKYASAKKLMVLAVKCPEELIEDYDIFVKLLDGENQILQWNALRILGSLSRADEGKRTARVLPKILGFLKSGRLVSANNAIAALGDIARNHLEFQEKILAELLKVSKYTFPTDECCRIVEGKVVEALESFDPELQKHPRVIAFVKRVAKSSRKSARKRAVVYLMYRCHNGLARGYEII